MKTKNLLLLLLTFTTLTLGAQSKPGCEPSSCGPENTKIEEANTITTLRKELQNTIYKMAKSPLTFDSAISTIEIQRGNSDYESILLMDQAATFVRQELIEKLPANKINSELVNLKNIPRQTKQEMMGSLQKKISLLSQQIESL